MTDVILRISGMDCGACAVRIVRALKGLPGLREVSVSDTAGCARLTYDEMAVDLGEIARSVARAGFDVPVGTAELRCPGADAGAEARLRAVFGVRSVAHTGDTFTVTLWPVGTDAAALPAVLGPGTELTAQHGGEETLQGRTRQRLARRLGLGVLLTALMLWRPPVFVQLVLAAAVLFGVGAALWRSTWRALRSGSLGPDAPGLLAALVLFAYSTYAAFAGLQPCFPALCGIACAQLAGKCAAQLVRGTLAAPVQRLRHLRPRTATVLCAPASARSMNPLSRARPGRWKRQWGTRSWPVRSTARAARRSRPRRSATRRCCSERSRPCSARRPCARRSGSGSSGRRRA